MDIRKFVVVKQYEIRRQEKKRKELLNFLTWATILWGVYIVMLAFVMSFIGFVLYDPQLNSVTTFDRRLIAIIFGGGVMLIITFVGYILWEALKRNINDV